MTDAERIKALEARVAELERMLSGRVGGLDGLPQMRAYYVGSPPIAKDPDK